MLLFNVLLKIYAVLAHNFLSKKTHQSHPVKINSRLIKFFQFKRHCRYPILIVSMSTSKIAS